MCKSKVIVIRFFIFFFLVLFFNKIAYADEVILEIDDIMKVEFQDSKITFNFSDIINKAGGYKLKTKNFSRVITNLSKDTIYEYTIHQTVEGDGVSIFENISTYQLNPGKTANILWLTELDARKYDYLNPENYKSYFSIEYKELNNELDNITFKSEVLEFPIIVNPDIAVFQFSELTTSLPDELNFENINFNEPFLTGEFVIGASIMNRDFGDKEIDVNVSTSGVGLEVDKEASFSFHGLQGVETIKSDTTFNYRLDARKYDNSRKEEYKIEIITQEVTTQVKPEILYD